MLKQVFALVLMGCIGSQGIGAIEPARDDSLHYQTLKDSSPYSQWFVGPIIAFTPVTMAVGHSANDQKILTLFLKDLIFNNGFGYTLFGEKPVSTTGYFSEEPLWNLVFFHSHRKFSFEAAWAIWENCAKALPSKNFLLIRENNPRYQGLTAVTLINKRSFLAAVEEHNELFKKILGEGITGEKLLAQLAGKQTGLFELLHGDEALYGILLGYGESNALAYKRRCELAPSAVPNSFPSEEPFTLYVPLPSSEFASIQEEYAFLEGRLTPFSYRRGLNLIAPLYFLALVENEETSLLKVKYQKMLRSLSEIYSKGDFLDLTLKQFVSASS